MPGHGVPYYKETSPSICSANQGTGFYSIETSIMKELKDKAFDKKSSHFDFQISEIHLGKY